MNVAWTGSDEFLGSIADGDTLYVRRKGANSLARLIHMSLTKDASDAPDNVTGLVASARERAGGGGN